MEQASLHERTCLRLTFPTFLSLCSLKATNSTRAPLASLIFPLVHGILTPVESDHDPLPHSADGVVSNVHSNPSKSIAVIRTFVGGRERLQWA